MSTHRKIEWLLFVLSVIGIALSLYFYASILQTILFGVGALFAGSHVFHVYDGHKANHVVVATSLALVAYTGYVALFNPENAMSEQSIIAGLALGILLSILSLRLRRDFHPK